MKKLKKFLKKKKMINDFLLIICSRLFVIRESKRYYPFFFLSLRGRVEMITPSAQENLIKRIFGLICVALVVSVVEGVGIFETLLVKGLHGPKSFHKCNPMTNQDMWINSYRPWSITLY